MLESVLIQEERKQHMVMNSKSEYSRCSLPRLTTRIGSSEMDKQRMKEKEEERKLEILIGEIGRRRKEKCQTGRKEVIPAEDTDVENTIHKRRKINEE